MSKEFRPRQIRNVSNVHGQAAWMYVNERTIELYVDPRNFESMTVGVFRIYKRQLKAMFRRHK